MSDLVGNHIVGFPMRQLKFQQYWVQVPLVSTKDRLDDIFEGEERDLNKEPEDTWEW